MTLVLFGVVGTFLTTAAIAAGARCAAPGRAAPRHTKLALCHCLLRRRLCTRCLGFTSLCHVRWARHATPRFGLTGPAATTHAGSYLTLSQLQMSGANIIGTSLALGAIFSSSDSVATLQMLDQVGFAFYTSLCVVRLIAQGRMAQAGQQAVGGCVGWGCVCTKRMRGGWVGGGEGR